MSKEVTEYVKDFIMVNKEFMSDNETYTHREKFIYTILQGIRNDLTGTSVISIDLLAGMLGLSSHTKNRTAIKESLASMEEKNLISLYSDVMGQNVVKVNEMKVTGIYAVRLYDAETKHQYFTMLELMYLRQFIKLDEKNKELPFSIYMNIVSRLYNSESSRKFAFPNIETIAEETALHKKTVMKYLEMLKSNNILYYETVHLGKDKDKNLYSKWHHSLFVTDAVKRIEAGERLEDV